MKKMLLCALLSVFILPISSLSAKETKSTVCPMSLDEEDRENIQKETRSGSYSVYYPTSTKKYKKVSKSGVFENKSKVQQHKSIKYSRTVSTQLSGGGSVELNLIGNKVNAHAEGAIGTSTKETVTTSITIPAKTTLHYELGSMFMKTTGTVKKHSGNCSITSKYVSADYSYSLYDKVY